MGAQQQEPDGLTGTLRNIRWRSGDGKYVVAQLIGGETVAGPSAAGPHLERNGVYRFSGRWHEHHTYGRRFVFDLFSTVAPHDGNGVIAYLNATAKNVGDIRALHLWRHFGSDAIRILKEHPEQVAGAGIMPLAAAREAAQSLHDAGAFDELKVPLTGLLTGRGFQMGLVIREAIRLWRGNAPAVVRRNPYALMLRRLPSCGFARCDRLYLDLGNPPHRLKRQAIWIWQQVRNETEGHTWVSAATIGQVLASLMGAEAQPLKAMLLAKRARLIAVRHDGGTWIADARKADNEQRLAEHAKGLLTWTPPNRASTRISRTLSDAEIFTDGL